MKSLHHMLCTLSILLGLAVIALAALSFQPGAAHLSFAYTILQNSPLRLSFALTPLAGVFLFPLGVLGALAGVYAIGYGAEYTARGHGVWLDAGLLSFIASMAFVLTAANVLTFMMGWELMSVTSYLLVVFDHERQDAVRSGLVYIAMAQLGSAFLLAAFLLLYVAAGSFSFAAFARTAPTLPPGEQTAIMLLALVGLFLKAGIMPLHIWLPRAHPVAPSHVSGLMSGVMIKLAIYALLLFGFTWFHAGQAWWGELITAAGILSAVAGAWLASQETRLKRILALGSIDNMGLITMAVGVAMTGAALHKPVLAGAALSAAVFQAYSHALFKSTLFQGAGAVLQGTHTDNLNQLGGLLRRMPATGASVLVALLSYAALPLSAGFISEWMLFSALADAAARELHSVAGLFAVGALLSLFLTTALTVLSAARIFGVAFLADPRSEPAAAAVRPPLSMRLAMAAGASLTVMLGLFASGALHYINQALRGGLLRPPLPPAVQAAPAVTLTILSFTALVFALSSGARRTRRSRTAATWTCGGQRTPSMSYSATGLSQPAAHALGGASPGTSFAMRYMYRPAWTAVTHIARAARQIQSGHVRSYLVYLFATMLALLLIAR